MSLQIHRAERADHLVAALGDLLADPLADPFAVEVVSVPTPGVERWLSQELSRRLGVSPGGTDGVCAGVSFPSPRRVVAAALTAALGEVAPGSLDDPAGEPVDPWQPERAVWPLLRVIDASRTEDWCRPLSSYLAGRTSGGAAELVGARRWTTARRLAELFAGYATNRPGMVDSWATGRDLDAAGRSLPPDLAWQAELWRRLAAELGTASPAERRRRAVAALRADPSLVDLPDRLSVFGATRLAPDHLAVLTALAGHRDVHLWLPHPSPALWDQVARALAETGGRAGPGPRAVDRSSAAARHPLLAYLGRDCRELQVVLAAAGASGDRHHGPAAAVGAPTNLLTRLQAEVAANAPPRPAAERPLLDPADRSVRVHASHGPDRQVEVLREVLVGLLADDPTLEPRDIVVMCPDIETFAPLVAATFGLDTGDEQAEHPGHRLRVRLADRALRQLNPLLSLLHRLVGLADSRVPASALLDLCALPPVARAFGFSTEDLDRLQDLVARAGVKWGLDDAHRGRFGMAGFRQNTWAAGLDRMLLGVTMDESEHHFIGTTLPLDDVDSDVVDLVGRFTECVSRVRLVTEACTGTKPVAGWVALFRHALDLLARVPATEAWQLGHAHGELAALAATAEGGADRGGADGGGADGGGAVELSLPEVAALLAEAFAGRPSRANFRTGTLTMCTLLPMRSVPHRVVCLLGVDDGVFPRRRPVDGDDITAVEDWVGDRDPRSEDRQLLLDAVLAAQQMLVVVHAGMDARTGADLPPAVPVGELLDSLDLTARTAGGRPVREAVTVRHRLQPFDPDNFVPGRLDQTRPAPFSFDRSALRGVRATLRPRRPAAGTVSAAGLPPVPAERAVELTDLVRFLGHPVRALLRQRAGLTTLRDDEPPDEQIPAELTGLDRWQVGERLLRAHLAGADLAALQAVEWRRGTLPPRAFGQQALEGVLAEVAELAAAARPFLVAPADRVEVVADLGSVRVSGLVPGVHGDDLLAVRFSRLSAKHRLESWLALLAVTVTRPDRPWRAVLVGRGGQAVLGPVDPGFAGTVLGDLLDLHRVGLGGPLPLAPRTAYEYARVRREGRSVAQCWLMLQRTWEDERDEAYEQFFGRGVTLETLLAVPSVPEEERGSLAEPSRFGTLARRVFHPLLGVEGARPG